ncbi:MAG TPA: DegV family protein [Gammaproteobacteria bacterium]|nr:DegV family protein [Gammaproteobacteria bacterium]
MRIGLVVDASCDLPDSVLEANGIAILPSKLELDGRSWLDERDPEQTLMLYRRYIGDRAVAARSSACGASEICDIFLRDLVLDFDRVLVLTAGADFSDMFARATEASYAILQRYRERRQEEGQGGGFSVRVLDSGSICAGEAALLCRALQLLEEGRDGFEAVRRTLREEVARTTCLLVPGDTWYLRRRGLDGRGRGIGRVDHALAIISDVKPVTEVQGGRRRIVARARGFRAACAVALERATRAIGQGLGGGAVTLSFGGDPRVIRQMPAYQALESRAATARLDLHFAVMSATMGARLGPGALSVAWIPASPAG